MVTPYGDMDIDADRSPATTTSPRPCPKEGSIRWSEAACLCADSKNKELALEVDRLHERRQVQSKLVYTKGFKARAPNMKVTKFWNEEQTKLMSYVPDPKHPGQDAGRDPDRQERAARPAGASSRTRPGSRSTTSSRPARADGGGPARCRPRHLRGFAAWRPVFAMNAAFRHRRRRRLRSRAARHRQELRRLSSRSTTSSFHSRARRVRRHHGAERLRQDHASAHRRRPGDRCTSGTSSAARPGHLGAAGAQAQHPAGLAELSRCFRISTSAATSTSA